LTENYSLGILVWQCVSGTFPFDSSDEVIEGPEAGRIRKLISRGANPWKINIQDDPLLQQVARVVQRCCNPRPTVRPSAAEVTHSLFDILTLVAANIQVAPQINEEVKARVSAILDTVDKNGTSSIGQKLCESDAEDLRTLAEEGDPTAAFLLGSAIWYGIVEAKENPDEMLMVAGKDNSKG